MYSFFVFLLTSPIAFTLLSRVRDSLLLLNFVFISLLIQLHVSVATWHYGHMSRTLRMRHFTLEAAAPLRRFNYITTLIFPFLFGASLSIPYFVHDLANNHLYFPKLFILFVTILDPIRRAKKHWCGGPTLIYDHSFVLIKQMQILYVCSKP